MTSPKLSECPSRGALEALLSNKLSPEEASQVHEHLSGCRSCRITLAGLGDDQDDADVPSAGSLARKTAAPSEDSTEAGAMADNRQDTPEQTTLAETELFQFLTPAVAKGELGRLGNYRVLRVVGQGGMGIVFEAEDISLSRRVALKCLRPDLVSESARKRFFQEARIAASLPHDHIVTIYQVGEERAVPYLAMEYLEGESVAKRLKREQRLPLAEALRITREVAEGLQAAHSRGLIHRDIKPANVWLESDGKSETFKRVKLLDFGLARPIESDENLTRHGDIVGTPSYMAPEQACGLPVDARTDLFSLGCMLYRMLTGEPPFRGEDTMAVLNALVHAPAPEVEKLAPTLPPSVAALLSELLSKSADGRPATAQVVIDRIRSIEKRIQSPANRPGPLAQTQTVSLVGRGGPRRRISWSGWLGAATIAAALLIGVAIEYRHLLGFGSQNGEEAAQANVARGSGPPEQPDSSGMPGGLPANEPAQGATKAAVTAGKPIKVGILHSRTGPLGASEGKLADIVLMAVDEINQSGGIRGRRIEAIEVDGRSRDEDFAAGARQLLTRDRVSVIFGCWTSSSRKSVRPIIEEHDGLLFYPLQNEGLEESPNIIYLGACPNQQLLPAVKWCYAFLEKRRFYLVGYDFIFSHAANEIMKDELKRLGTEPVGESYLPLDGTGAAEIVERILQAKPDMIVNTISGDANIAFFRELRKAGITPDKIPTISFGVTENTLRAMGETVTEGDYGVWCYFQSNDTPRNEEFLAHCQARFGKDRAITDPMEISYCGVYLWKQAVMAALSDDPVNVRTAILGHAYDAPEGTIRVDRTQYCWRTPRIGRITAEREFEQVWSAPRPVAPEPFPASRSRDQWDAFLNDLYQGWGMRWHSPTAMGESAENAGAQQ